MESGELYVMMASGRKRLMLLVDNWDFLTLVAILFRGLYLCSCN